MKASASPMTLPTSRLGTGGRKSTLRSPIVFARSISPARSWPEPISRNRMSSRPRFSSTSAASRMLSIEFEVTKPPRNITRNGRVGVAPEHHDSLGSAEQESFERAHPPCDATVGPDAAEVDESLRPEVRHLEEEARALDSGEEVTAQGRQRMNRNSDHHLRAFAPNGAGDEGEDAEHEHVHDPPPVVAAIAGGGDPDVPHAVDVLLPPQTPSQRAGRPQVVMAEGADENRRRVAFLHQPAADVEAPGGEAVGWVRVVVDDPDPHSADYLR